LGSMIVTSYDILVIILSITLAIFLILSIIALTKVLKLLKSLQTIATKGEEVMDSAKQLSDTLAQNAGAAGMLKMLMRFVAGANGKNKGGK